MTSIYIGVCRTRDDERFKQSFRNFTDSICGHYSVCLETVRDKFLPDAQNRIVRGFLASNCQYLLLLDDDHWGHTKEMLGTLIGANTYMATMKTYSRHYPYSVAVWDRIPNNLVIPVEIGEDYRECDLTGFPMTLLRRDLFDKLEEPFFRPVEAEGRDWNTDIDFCERLGNIGIKPVACFQHCLNHDKITQDNVFKYRRDERMENNNIARFNMLIDIQNQNFVVK